MNENMTIEEYIFQHI